MTDPELVHRAEQAYLGALLARQGRAGTATAVAGDAGPGALAGLRPQDFADPVHQAVYAALASQALPALTGPAAVYERLRGMLTRRLSPRARDAAAYMAQLPGQCPDPASMAAYAAMVTEASHARAVPTPPTSARPPARVPQLSAESPRLASAAQWLESTRAGRHQASAREAGPAYAGTPSQPRRTPDGLDRQTARLARALGPDVRRLAGRAAPPAAPVPAPAGNQAAPLTADARQQQLLADLMLHRADRDVISWLPAMVFTAGHNRTLYQLIRRRLDDGQPVDPLIIAWDASALIGASAPAAGGESLPATALRLGALNPDPGSAAALALSLHTAHLRTGAFGLDWRRERETVPAPIIGAAAADRARTAAPVRAGQEPAAAAPHPAGAAPAPPVVSPAQPAPAAARRPVTASPRHASGLPLRRPPLPGPPEPGPVPRA